MHLKEGTLLNGGKYRITRFINSGGFGCTYEAIHTKFDTQVAIKEFFVRDFCNRDEHSHVSVGTDSKRELVQKLLKKFTEEAKSVFKMRHPGIVKVTDIFDDNGTAYYVMDYIPGQSLNELVRCRGALPEQQALKYIRQAADALRYVHSLNRLHLDVKPGNIMLGDRDDIILIDFGASKHYDDSTGENTSTLMGVNTPGYAPLEQMRQSFTTFLPSTDIYALGATLYKLLTGITPPDAIDLVSGTAHLRHLPAGISKETRQAVAKAMQTRVDMRPQSIDEFLDILDGKAPYDASLDNFFSDDETALEEPTPSPAAISNPSVEPKPVSDPAPVYTPGPKPAHSPIKPEKRVNKKAIGIIAAVVAVLVFGAIWLFGGSHPKQGDTAAPVDTVAIVEETVEIVDDSGDTVKDLVYTNTFGKKFTYTGKVKDGVPHGNGVGKYTDGTVYEGEYRDGMRYGQGTLTEQDGKVVGRFVADKQVEGTCTLTDGTYYKGTFDANEAPCNGVWYDAQGNVISKVVNGNY